VGAFELNCQLHQVPSVSRIVKTFRRNDEGNSVPSGGIHSDGRIWRQASHRDSRGEKRPMSRLWVRALVAFVVMEGLTTIAAASWYIYGPARGVEGREFPSAFAYALFASVMSMPFHLGALLGMIVPVAAILHPLRWSLSLPAATLVGATLSVPAFCVVVIGGWLSKAARARTL
jgi:hypothetical protein